MNENSHTAQEICTFANRYRKRDGGQVVSMHYDQFTVKARLHWDDGGRDWLIRFTFSGRSSFIDEKVQNEAVAMKFVALNTPIPIPRVITYGTAADNPTGLGPFIIMTWVEGRKMSDVLWNTRGRSVEETRAKREILYGQMADILLELWNLNFDRIGSLVQTEITRTFSANRRPSSQGISELSRVWDLSDHIEPSRIYHSAVEYIYSLLELQSIRLERQRTIMSDTASYREQYAARHLMKAIALSFVSRTDNYGPFKLFAEGLRPEHVLVDDSLQVTGVTNWEFCYSGPVQFAGSMPDWLLPLAPHIYIKQRGLHAFLESYVTQGNSFLEVLQKKEDGRGYNSDRLSVRMRQSIQDNSAWFNLACRSVTGLDIIYWNLIDEWCWGPRTSITERVYVVTNTGLHKSRDSTAQPNNSGGGGAAKKDSRKSFSEMKSPSIFETVLGYLRRGAYRRGKSGMVRDYSAR
ncbi:hypothetical protein BJX96DRAFT_162862 [Aspergillus floccosus]